MTTHEMEKKSRGLGRRKGKEHLKPKPPHLLYFSQNLTVKYWLLNSCHVRTFVLKSRRNFQILSKVESLRQLSAGKDSVAKLSTGFEKKVLCWPMFQLIVMIVSSLNKAQVLVITPHYILNISNTRDSVFRHISKHWEESWKYDAQRKKFLAMLKCNPLFLK